MLLKNLPAAALVGGFFVFNAYTVWAAGLGEMPVVAGQVSGTAAASGTTVGSGVNSAKSAVVRVLDKQSNRVDHLTLEAGKPQKWGGLTVSLQRCAWNVGGVAVQDVAWLDVTAASGEPEFHGWMFNTFPSVATFDHPRYDVQLEKCTRPAGYAVPVPGRTAPAQPSGPEHEGGDDEAPSATNNPYVVPGISDEAPAAPASPAAAQPAPATQPAAQPVAEPGSPAAPAEPAAPAAVAEPNPAPAAPSPDRAPAEPAALPAAGEVRDQIQLQRMMDLPH